MNGDVLIIFRCKYVDKPNAALLHDITNFQMTIVSDKK